ncbi:MAG: methanogenesis marker 2 protein [Candidatus Methanoplasma sp.]|jgi:putative methanogenesis marker protein 2|nr:methanogenesis marker 2 protein [Candidatus Methanoplasma sp.]
MSLDAIVGAIRTFPGVTRKKAIQEIVGSLSTKSFPYVAASEGEDAAAIEYGDDYILFAADGIMESLVDSDPYYAGYFAVLVNVNDIAAMGGRPLAMVDVLSISKNKVCSRILKGMSDAVMKFNVPIVGGHTHPDCKHNSISISIIGTVPKKDIVLSCKAKDNDDIVFVMDLDGFYPDGLKYAWDTTSRKDSSYVRAQMEMMSTVASKHLVHSAKDMSNPGCIGTLGMMLESSMKGGTVDVDRIPAPEGADITQWILSYQGCGFVFACPPENSSEVIRLFGTVGCTGAVVGKIDDTMKLKVSLNGESKVLFDFEKDIITGCSPKKKSTRP